MYVSIFDGPAQEMQAWVALVTETIEAEFPGFGLLRAMSIFNLNPRTREAEVHEESMTYIQESAKRLCNVFQVDQQGFIDEFMDMRPIALHHATLESASSFESWQQAVRKVSRRSGHVHPTGNLVKLLMRLGAWDGCTTSEVERVFAKLRKCERCLSDQNRCLELKMFWDYDRIGPKVHSTAKHIWEQLFGAPRSGSTTRLDKGVKRKRAVPCIQFYFGGFFHVFFFAKKFSY